jgi:hypothetical protein
MKYLTLFSIYLSVCFLHFLHLNPTPELTVKMNEKLDIKKPLLIIDTKNIRFKQMFDNQKYVQIHKNSFDFSIRQWSNSCYCFTDVSNDWQEEIFPNKQKMTLNQSEVITQNDIERFDNFFSRNFNNPKEIATRINEKLDNFYLSAKGQDHQEYSNKYNFKYIALINTWHDTVDINIRRKQSKSIIYNF